MNQIVARWNEAYKRHVSDQGGPDTVLVDDEENISYQIREAPMPVEKQLPANQFDNVIRWVKNVDAERLKSMLKIVEPHATRLGLSYRPRAAVKGPAPAGSDHFDSGSLNEWLGNVQPGDAEAVKQVLVIFATIKSRVGG